MVFWLHRGALCFRSVFFDLQRSEVPARRHASDLTVAIGSAGRSCYSVVRTRRRVPCRAIPFVTVADIPFFPLLTAQICSDGHSSPGRLVCHTSGMTIVRFPDEFDSRVSLVYVDSILNLLNR